MTRSYSLPAEDQLAILELLSRYNQAVGEGDPEGVAACFTDDGYVNGKNGYSQGHAQLRKIGLLATAERQLRHIVTNTIITARAETTAVADVKSHLLYFEVTSAGITFLASGIYTDVVAKVDGEWKFRSRVMTPAVGGTWPGQRL